MDSLRALVITVIGVGVALIAYNAYNKATFDPNAQTKGAIRDVIGEADRISASQTKAEAKPYLDKARKENKVDIEKVRQSVQPAAKRAGQLNNLDIETRGIAKGGNVTPAHAPSAASPSVPADRPRPEPMPLSELVHKIVNDHGFGFDDYEDALDNRLIKTIPDKRTPIDEALDSLL